MRKMDEKVMERLYAYIDQYVIRYQTTPSTREIGEYIGCAKSTTYRYLLEMNRRGMIHYSHGAIQTSVTAKSDRGSEQTAVLNNSVSCGVPLLSEQNVDSYVVLPTAVFGRGPFFIVQANGDSMIKAGIEDGDLVVIRQQSDARQGDIVVAEVDGATTLKRFYYGKDGGIDLVPENDSEPVRHVAHCSIQGVAVKTIKEIPKAAKRTRKV